MRHRLLIIIAMRKVGIAKKDGRMYIYKAVNDPTWTASRATPGKTMYSVALIYEARPPLLLVPNE